MKKAFKPLFLLPVLILTIGASAQRYEFHKYDNGLIYPDTTLAKLKPIADSLQLAFPKVALNKKYLSQLHIKAHFVSFSKNKPQVLEAIKDILANIPFHQFEQKYPDAEFKKELLIIKSKYVNHQKKNITGFSSIQPGNSRSYNLKFKDTPGEHDKPLQGKWLCDYDTIGSSPSLKAFYCIEEFSPKPLPDYYAKWIQYATYLTDTIGVFHYPDTFTNENCEYDWDCDYNDSSAVGVFIAYMYSATQKPPAYSRIGDDYQNKFKEWYAVWPMRLDSLYRNDPQFDMLLAEAIKVAIVQGNSTYELEACAQRYYNPGVVLELKRNHNIMGSSSTDRSPRGHTLNIATLSADIYNWPIFLRSHLNLLNDNFTRKTDGSYAWEERNTFIKELEVFDIHVTDLLLGTALRIDNPGNHHYYGKIMRIGRALSETSQPAEVENKLLQMISDKHLDDYNRILMYYVFTNYNKRLKDKVRKTQNDEKLLVAVKALPNYLAQKISTPQKED